MRCFLLAIIILPFSFFAQAPPQGIAHRGTVYDSNGNVFVGTVGIEVSILENSDAGTEVYRERFLFTTNPLGQYSVEIGKGTALPPWNGSSFSTINWAGSLKYLKIRYDLTGGTNYSVVASNQLMSVPYAFFSLNSKNSQVKVYNNIAELRAVAGSVNEIAFVKGHTYPGDGGEGSFICRELPLGNPGLVDDDGVFVRNNTSPIGWVRIVENRINIKYYGANGSCEDSNSCPPADQGVIIQKAIDFANKIALNPKIIGENYFRDYANSGAVVYIPAGIYKIMNKITLKYGVSIEGDGATASILKADNSTQPNGSMIEMDGGQLVNIHVCGLTLDGNAEVNDPANITTSDTKNGIYIKAYRQTPEDSFGNTGGLWSSKFQDIVIKKFNGTGLIIEGKGLDSQVNVEDTSYPNQNTVFENVYIARQRDNSRCLLIRAQAGQLTFINCGFDGLRTTTNRTNKGFNVAIESKGVPAAGVEFLTCTFQYSEYGIITEYAENINFDNCWFEYLDNGILVKSVQGGNKSNCINIINSRFANAAGFGSEPVPNKNPTGGSCIEVSGGTSVSVRDNYVTVSAASFDNNNNYFVRNSNMDSKVNLSNNAFRFASLGKCFGVINKLSINIVGNVLTTESNKYVTVNCLPSSNTANYIKRIVSDLNPGDMLTVKAIGTGQIKFDNSTHIIYPKTSAPTSGPFVLNANEVATFLKIDNPLGGQNETYQLISVLRSF